MSHTIPPPVCHNIRMVFIRTGSFVLRRGGGNTLSAVLGFIDNDLSSKLNWVYVTKSILWYAEIADQRTQVIQLCQLLLRGASV